ncbi:SDR family oxidoreductase [Bacillus testis]|uniref:SDR family oxidoreductase n=1 Tax=Bacillus testis TaxID=1622072 RepID=UPI00067F617C|nr:SDR family oxidoreductase [Bacillus testis]
MKHSYFFTGFPGFIAARLIKEMIKNDTDFLQANLLVLPAFAEKAKQDAEAIEKEMGIPFGSLRILTGDITKPGLGIEENEFLEEITHVFHLAAIYDLAVPKDVAYLVNVEGTRNVNEWVRRLKNLKRYIYFSTAYVAGTREGLLLETELIRPPAFKNYYEETKYEAEKLVEGLKSEVPVTIIRPGIVKGHSVTGETVKFDGPYFILNTLRAMRFLPVIPYIGRSASKINLVPIDYIIQSVAYLSLYGPAEGKTYHLTDPHPYTATEIYEMFAVEMYGKKPKGTIPLPLCKACLSLAPMRKFLHTEKETIDYFTWKGDFDASQAIADLATAKIACPDFKEGVPAMVRFYKENQDHAHYQVAIK